MSTQILSFWEISRYKNNLTACSAKFYMSFSQSSRIIMLLSSPVSPSPSLALIFSYFQPTPFFLPSSLFATFLVFHSLKAKEARRKYVVHFLLNILKFLCKIIASFHNCFRGSKLIHKPQVITKATQFSPS